jgi:hypothetical protein
MKFILVLFFGLALIACNQLSDPAGRGGKSDSLSTNQRTEDSHSPNQNSSASNSAKNEMITLELPDGHQVFISQKNQIAYYAPKNRNLEIKVTLYSANIHFLPIQDGITSGCEHNRETIRIFEEKRLPKEDNPYLDALHLEAGVFRILDSDEKALLEVKKFLTAKGYNYPVVFESLNLDFGSFPTPSLLIRQQILSRDLPGLLNDISQSLSSRSQISLTIAEFCDLISPETSFIQKDSATKVQLKLGF